MNKNLNQRTPGEELWLWRLRENLKQATAARKLNCGRTTYWKYETDRLEWKWSKPWSRPSVAALLSLARRRAGWGLYGTAARVGVSQVTLLEWEREAHPTLITWWLNRGWAF